MKDLLYKEFKLSWHPSVYLILLCGALLLIPSWPFFIAFGYIFIAFNNVFYIGRANEDIFFTASLPVRKRDIVRARVCSIAIVELLQVIIAIPFAVINNAVYTNGNMAGMNTNFAFFGFVLVMYAIFNIIFLPGFYKTAYKIGVPMLLAIFTLMIFAAAVSVAVVVVPVLETQLNGLGADHLLGQLPVLAAGILFFVGLTLLACRISENRFTKVDL